MTRSHDIDHDVMPLGCALAEMGDGRGWSSAMRWRWKDMKTRPAAIWAMSAPIKTAWWADHAAVFKPKSGVGRKMAVKGLLPRCSEPTMMMAQT